MDKKKLLTILVPTYNEEKNITPFLEEIIPILEALNSLKWSILFVNDGSQDNTLNILSLANQNDSRIQIINLSRNFGKEAALTCGLDHIESDAVVIMDADLQHPPEILPQLVQIWLEKEYDMVIPLNQKRAGQGIIYKKLASYFYKCIDTMSNIHIPPGGSDFRLLDRKVIDAIKLLPERNRFMKALYAYPGFKVREIPYSVRDRKFGTTKWNYKKLWVFALDGIFGFSSAPLKIWTYVGFIVSLLSFTYSIYITIDVIINGKTLPGWPTVVCLILFFNGLLMVNNGIMGEYIARIFEEVKQRPIYIVEKKIGFKDERD